MLGRIETRTRDRIYCQTIRTVRDISRDDRARIATCSLRTLTDRLKENYSIDIVVRVNIIPTRILHQFVVGPFENGDRLGITTWKIMEITKTINPFFI